MLKLDKEVILLNKIAQHKADIITAVKLYDDSLEDVRNDLYRTLEFCLMQSKPKKDSIDSGIELAKIEYPKISLQPKSNMFMVFTPNNKEEEKEAFCLMLYIFRESDTKRRNTSCANGCNHPWHNLHS